MAHPGPYQSPPPQDNASAILRGFLSSFGGTFGVLAAIVAIVAIMCACGGGFAYVLTHQNGSPTTQQGASGGDSQQQYTDSGLGAYPAPTATPSGATTQAHGFHPRAEYSCFVQWSDGTSGTITLRFDPPPVDAGSAQDSAVNGGQQYSMSVDWSAPGWPTAYLRSDLWQGAMLARWSTDAATLQISYVQKDGTLAPICAMHATA